MRNHMLLAAAAILLAAPALADETCLQDTNGAQCDIFMDDYHADKTPIGTTNVWTTKPFLLENFRYFNSGSTLPVPRRGGDVLYWDGTSAMVVPEDSGPQVKIADW